MKPKPPVGDRQRRGGAFPSVSPRPLVWARPRWGIPSKVKLAEQPNLTTSLRLDPFAPRGARHHVCRVDSPSPDLRNTVALLTSEIVTRAVRQSQVGEDTVELRVWMPAEVVRVELRGPSERLFSPHPDDGPRYEVSLLDQLADRWSVDSGEGCASIWFEIDRHAPNAAGGHTRRWRARAVLQRARGRR
jgi:hypothetical protein